VKFAIPGARQFKTQKVRSIVDAAIVVLAEYKDAGFSVTLRQLFYRLVADGVLVNRVADYRSVDLVRDMVASGELPHIPKGGGKERTHIVIDRVDLDKWIEKKKQKVA